LDEETHHPLQRKNEKHGQTSMSLPGFEPAIPLFDQSMTMQSGQRDVVQTENSTKFLTWSMSFSVC